MLRSSISYSLMISALVACSSSGGGEEDIARDLQGIERTALKILDHNLAGGHNNDGVNGLNAIQDQIDDKFKPDIVLLQEVCTAQFERLRDKYVAKGWGVAFQATKSTHEKCQNKPKGMVIMSKHGLKDVIAHPLPMPDGPITPSLFCASVTMKGVPADRIRACTSHFRAGDEPAGVEPADDEARKAQGKAAADLVAAEITDKHRLVIITGDLNSEPKEASLTPLYAIGNGKGLFYEADQTDTDYCKSGECRGGGPTFYKQKVDYVFLSKNRATGTLSLGTVNSKTSDHRMVRVVAKVDLTTNQGVSERQSTEPGMPNSPPNDPDAQATPVLPEEQPTEPIPETDPEAPPTEQPPSACDNDCWRAALTPWLSYESPAKIRDDRRVGRRVFDPRFYLSLYADVRANGGPNNNDYAEYHWLKNGIAEGRMGSPLFDAPYYLAANPDVAAAIGVTNYAGALEHYQDNGIAEGRRGSLVFDAKYYMARYGDLPAAFGGGNFAAVLDHFQQTGLSEGRQASADFAPAWYLGTNPDLQASVGATDFRAGLRHYILYGRPEGRPGAP